MTWSLFFLIAGGICAAANPVYNWLERRAAIAELRKAADD